MACANRSTAATTPCSPSEAGGVSELLQPAQQPAPLLRGQGREALPGRGSLPPVPEDRLLEAAGPAVVEEPHRPIDPLGQTEMRRNEARLLQLLDKLLANASGHSSGDGEIRVELRGVKDGWVELTVENDGDALPQDKERMFEAFVSSQSRPENLGLGLYVAQTIARNHRGHITAEDLSESLGARFVVQLPELVEETRTVDDEQSRRLASGRAPLPVAKTQEQL